MPAVERTNGRVPSNGVVTPRDTLPVGGCKGLQPYSGEIRLEGRTRGEEELRSPR